MYNHKKNGSNVAVGAFALRGDSSGFWNTAVGSETMDASTANNVGNLNTALGFRALRNHVVGNENTALGVGALEADSSGYYNTAVGRGSLFLHKKGSYNTAIGYLSGRWGDSTYEVTNIGTQAAFHNKVPYTTAVGTNALFYNNVSANGDSRAGKENTAVGQLALFSNSLGIKNTAVGYHALTSNENGYYTNTPSRNTAVGDSAANGSFGNDITAVGSHALSKTEVVTNM
ncbi:MAG: hypothetical protein IPL50_00125 [Chitinophagaceae bacterium]|nr:hypothetical protein [Chitinophagaceae bacterium]